MEGSIFGGNDTEKTSSTTLLSHDEVPNGKANILKRCLYDPVHKRKVLHSVWIALILFSLGVISSQNGTTLLDLQILTNTSLGKSSFIIFAFNVGLLFGSALSSFLYDRMNKYLLLLLSMLGSGVSSIISPYCFHFVAMIFIRALVGIFVGIIFAAGNTEQIRVWGNDGTELMQLIHFCFALGGVISPLYTEPFLAKKPSQNTSSGSISNFTDLSTVIPETKPTTDVRYAFIITGVICIISGIPWLIIYLQHKFGSREDVIRLDRIVTQRKIPLRILLYMIFMICLMYALYCCMEVGFIAFLMTFLVEEFNETKSKGANLTAVFCALFAASRFTMIFITQRLTAVQLLYISCLLMIIASVFSTISAMFSAIYAFFAFTAILAISVSPLFPTSISWIESHLLKVTSRVSACIMVSSSIGGIISPLFTGYLMENVSTIWFCYLLTIEVVLMCFVFVTLHVTSTFFINKHYAFEHEISISVDPKVSVANGGM